MTVFFLDLKLDYKLLTQFEIYFVKELNSENATCGQGQHGICIHQLTGKLDVPADILKERPDVSYILKFDMYYYSKQELFNSGHYYRYQRKYNALHRYIQISHFKFKFQMFIHEFVYKQENYRT